jgi:transcriptional regulator with XRE-family HTH domain
MRRVSQLEPIYPAVGLAIRDFRQDRGLSQAQLAEQTSLDRAGISNVENGVTRLPLHVLVEISVALGVPVGEILDYAAGLASLRQKFEDDAAALRRARLPRLPGEGSA